MRYTLSAHIEALDSVLEEEGPFVLVGHSLGATLAVAYAARRPEKVKALGLLSLPAFRDALAARRWLRPWPRGWFFTNMALNAAACLFTRRVVGPVLPFLLRDLPVEVARDVLEHNVFSSTTSLWEVIFRNDVEADLERLPAELPVVFVHGSDDVTAPGAPIHALAASRPGAELFVLDGVDHHPWLRDPAACASLLNGIGSLPVHGHSTDDRLDGEADADVLPGPSILEGPGGTAWDA